MLYFFKLELLLLKVGSNITTFIGKVAASQKKDTATIFRFKRGPNWYVLRLIQWQNLKRKIVSVSFFCDAT